MNINKSSFNISVGVLYAITVLDVVTVCMMYIVQTCIWVPIAIYAIGIALIWSLAKRRVRSPLAGFSPVILTKLLGNAIAPSKLGVAYLLMFVVHIGWLTDSTFNIIRFDRQGIDISCLIPLCCSIGGLACIVGFFPDPYRKKKEKTVKVIVSGMSLIGQKQWGILNTAFENNDIKVVKKMSLIPLVRMLVQHNVDETCRMLILKSSKQTKDDLFPICVKINGHAGAVAKPVSAEEQKKMDTLRSEICTATTFLKLGETDAERAEREALYEKYGVGNLSGSVSPDRGFDVFLILLIKLFANFEFPDKFEQIRNLDVEFTPSCDYDKYAECFDKMAKAIQKYDNDAYDIEFNITPGTALVSSVMTLLAIDGDKKLYYHDQSPDKTMASDAIQEVDKTKLPIENLLSQALEKISGKRELEA